MLQIFGLEGFVVSIYDCGDLGFVLVAKLIFERKNGIDAGASRS